MLATAVSVMFSIEPDAVREADNNFLEIMLGRNISDIEVDTNYYVGDSIRARMWGTGYDFQPTIGNAP